MKSQKRRKIPEINELKIDVSHPKKKKLQNIKKDLHTKNENLY